MAKKWQKKKWGTAKKNKLEEEFEGILIEMGLNYEFHFMYWGFEFDFCLLDYDILIEVDGDYWHANKKTGNKPIYESQKKNLINDQKKNRIVKLNPDYTLLRFWESDIKKKRDWVIQKLKDATSL